MSVTVAGSGAFGIALAISLARNGPVALWSRSAEQVRDMIETGQNRSRLPGVELPTDVRPTDNTAALERADIILVAVPMQQLREFLQVHAAQMQHAQIVVCCKGMELTTGLGPVSVTSQVLPDAIPALLTGPSFAVEIARGLPTALTLACSDPVMGRDLQERLTTGTLRLYRTTDTIGAEIGGALKNVIAIACGAVIGAGLGNSARAALMTRGYAEMVRMAVASGALADTLAGLSGFGDLALTCTSEQSRNFRLGLSIGREQQFDPSVTVEGAATARAVAAWSRERGIDMPITNAVEALVTQKQTLTDAIAQLLARSLKPE